jgi:DNA-binding response OmpR family regulator
VKHQQFCHNCGADISLDEPIRIDDFSMIGDGYPLLYKGQVVKLTLGERLIVWSLLKAYPDHVKRSTLLDRLDSEGGDNLVSVMLVRIRAALARAGAPSAIETLRGQGIRWKPGGGDDVARTLATGDAPITEILHQLYAVPEPRTASRRRR